MILLAYETKLHFYHHFAKHTFSLILNLDTDLATSIKQYLTKQQSLPNKNSLHLYSTIPIILHPLLTRTTWRYTCVEISESWLIWYCMCSVRNAEKRRVTRKEAVVVNLWNATCENMEKYFLWTRNKWVYNFRESAVEQLHLCSIE